MQQILLNATHMHYKSRPKNQLHTSLSKQRLYHKPCSYNKASPNHKPHPKQKNTTVPQTTPMPTMHMPQKYTHATNHRVTNLDHITLHLDEAWGVILYHS